MRICSTMKRICTVLVLDCLQRFPQVAMHLCSVCSYSTYCVHHEKSVTSLLQSNFPPMFLCKKYYRKYEPFYSIFSSFPDPNPDPLDPHVFGPPGSTSQRYGSGSGFFYHQAKIVRYTLIPTVLCLLFDFLSLKNDVNKCYCLLLFKGTFTSFFKDKKSKRSHKTVGIKVYLTIYADDRRIRINTFE